MKYVLFLLALSLQFPRLFGQELTVDMELEQGHLQTIYQRAGNMVVEINRSGTLMEILAFDSEVDANAFMKRPHELYKPLQSLQVAGVEIYFDSYTAVGYFAPNQLNAGKVSQIADLKIDYYSKHEHNTGKIKQVGDVVIEYYTPSEYHTGKLKRIDVPPKNRTTASLIIRGNFVP